MQKKPILRAKIQTIFSDFFREKLKKFLARFARVIFEIL